jgi:hypothetical protein
MRRFPRPFLLVVAVLVESCVLIVSCRSVDVSANDGETPPQVGQRIPTPTHASHVFTVHRGGDLCSGSVRVRGVDFNFDVWCGQNKIVYVQTLDPKFVTKEGLRIGTPLRDAVAIGGNLLAAGECGVVLRSGWIARPAIGADARGPVPLSCSELLDGDIRYFDTIFDSE